MLFASDRDIGVILGDVALEASPAERMVTAVLCVSGCLEPVSVKTQRPVPKAAMKDVLAADLGQIDSEISIIQARLDAAKLEREASLVRSPLDGVVADIYTRAGERIMAFTGPTPDGTMLMEAMPMPTRPMASSGRPPSSPHSVTFLPCWRPFSTIMRMAESAAGESGS